MMINDSFSEMLWLRHKAALLLLALFPICGCQYMSDAQSNNNSVYICSESKEVFLLPEQQTPAIHPQTGKATLMPGLYCEKCQKWQAAPPREIWHQMKQGIHCKTCKHPLTTEGTLPGSSSSISSSE